MLEAQGSARAHTVLAALGMACDLVVVILVGMTEQAPLVQADCQGKGPICSHFLQRLTSVLHRWKRERLKKFIWRDNPCNSYFIGKVFLYWDYVFCKEIFCQWKMTESSKFLFYCQISGGSVVLNISSALNISPLIWRDSSVTEVKLICDVGGKVEIILWKVPKYHSAIVCPILEQFALCPWQC